MKRKRGRPKGTTKAKNDVFMIKVKNGLKEFLSPFYRSN